MRSAKNRPLATCVAVERRARTAARPRAQATNAAAERQAHVTATAEHVMAGGVTLDGDQPRTAPKQHTPPSSIEDEWQRKQSMRGRATSRTKRSAKHRDPATHTVVEQRAQAAAEAMKGRSAKYPAPAKPAVVKKRARAAARGENARAGGVTDGRSAKNHIKQQAPPSSIEHKQQRRRSMRGRVASRMRAISRVSPPSNTHRR